MRTGTSIVSLRQSVPDEMLYGKAHRSPFVIWVLRSSQVE